MMTAPKSIYQLVEKFERNKDQYKHQDYNESQVRAEFVDPLFEALGWNMRDSSQVKREEGVPIGDRVKHPDYSFMVGRDTSFYVEAKKPSINLRDSDESALQLRAYGWSGNTDVGILTNFEEFVVYDCRVEPKADDFSDTARVWLLTYEHYIEQWEELVKYFSWDAVQAGEHRAILESNPRGIFGVDEAFLRDMERWRVALAKDMALRNPTLVQRDLNLLVQRTIDRIVFLRIAEDRSIESYGRLERTASEGKQVYEELKILFREADDKYNSGLFHFNPDAARASEADDLSMKIALGSGPLRSIISELYPWKSLYQFSVIPADILGQVYERFLGKVIELKAGKAQVTDKPEVRKAGGVYYTPTYIVEYIVANTVGKWLKGKTPAQVEKLRALDPACGSGSFLIGAYQYLMDWHLDYYQARLKENPNSSFKSRVRNIDTDADTNFVLTIQEKQRILLNNIYGVDLDQNAVEVTKLSLLLKMLEKEHSQAPEQYALMKTQILPDLGWNIRWGNSLIGTDFYSDKQIDMFDEEAMYRIKAFDWESGARGFGEIMAQGGFDVVIGNPPYVSMLILDKMQDKSIKPYWKKVYSSAAGAFDIYVLFIEKGITLLRENGLLGFIVPNKFLAAEYAIKFRKWLIENAQFVSLTDYSRIKVWDISVYPMIPIFRKSNNNKDNIIKVFKAKDQSNQNVVELPHKESSILGEIPDAIWSFLTQQGADILIKILKNSISLEDISEVCGSATVAEGAKYPQLLIERNAEVTEANYSRFVVSGNVFRYMAKWETHPVRFTRKSYNQPLISLSFPMPKRRIQQAKTPKLMVCKVALEPRAFLDLHGEYTGAYVTYIFEKSQPLHYLCGIINSKLIDFLFRLLYDALAMGSGYLRFQPPQMRRLPIRTIDFDKRRDVVMHDKMVNLVETMLDLHKQLPGLSGIQLDTVKARIESTDRQIDRLVYRLYGLTADEIAIVEGK